MQAAGRVVTRAQAAAALGLASARGSLSRIANYAADDGWIVTKRGPEGGFALGSTQPPAESAAAPSAQAA